MSCGDPNLGTKHNKSHLLTEIENSVHHHNQFSNLHKDQVAWLENFYQKDQLYPAISFEREGQSKFFILSIYGRFIMENQPIDTDINGDSFMFTESELLLRGES